MAMAPDPRTERRDPSFGVDEEIRQLRGRLVPAALALLIVLAVGAIGYRALVPGTTWVNAIYMTFITLTTVGFGEVVDLSGSPAGRIFTMVLLTAGIGIAAYLASAATAVILEGQLQHAFWRRRMQKEAGRMTGHYIVCGSGETAVQAARELAAVGRELVVICEKPERAARLSERLPGVPLLTGDPTDEAMLRRAGVDRAAGLIVSSPDDKDNLVVTLTARNLNKGVRIISRATLPEMGTKMRQVGADAVVTPSLIGGLRMASELVRPTVVTFLDQMLRDRDRNLRVSELTLAPGSAVVGRRLGDLQPLAGSDSLLLACRDTDGRWTYNPPADFRLAEGATLVVMGSPRDLSIIEDNLR